MARRTVRHYKLLTIPWFPSALKPNSSTHWRAKLKPKEQYREACRLLALQNIPELPEGNIHLYVTFHAPNKRAFDLDNALAAAKNGIDGVCLAWGINDKRFRPITIDFGEPVKNGKITLTLT